jgi:TolB protein
MNGPDRNIMTFSRRGALTLGAGAALATAAGLRSARAAVRVDITQGNVQPLPIALPDFIGGSAPDSEMARNVTGVITNNLRKSGLFAPIDPAAFIERITNPGNVPRFPDWRQINAQALVTGGLTRQSDGPASRLISTPASCSSTSPDRKSAA